MANWEDKLRDWAKPPSQAEEQRCENAGNMVRNAIGSSSKLKGRNIKVFAQGSYRNNTNVSGESDVDIGVLCYDTFLPDYPEGTTHTTFGNVDASYQYTQFKNEVGEALSAYFGAAAVRRGNKAFDIRENTYHVEIDAAPFFEHRRYPLDGRYLSGVELLPDNGIPPRVINWPEQHYENGVSKNNATGKRFKALVRVLKSLRNEMDGKGIAAAKPIIGFLSECLVWNVPNDRFGNSTYYEDLRQVLIFLYVNTENQPACNDWGEVSELKYLFRGSEKWTREQANAFLLAAWQYVGFS